MTMIATLNAVLVDGGKDDIITIAVVENEHEGELWFNENKPDDGTQVDYALHNISEVFAAPDLLDACKLALNKFRLMYDKIEAGYDAEDLYTDSKTWPLTTLRNAITEAECGTSAKNQLSELEKHKQNQEWICPRCGHRNATDNEVCMGAEMGDGRCGKPKQEKVKPLAQYLSEYIKYEMELLDAACSIGWAYDYNSWRELLEQALDAYESTENVTIKIERV